MVATQLNERYISLDEQRFELLKLMNPVVIESKRGPSYLLWMFLPCLGLVMVTLVPLILFLMLGNKASNPTRIEDIISILFLLFIAYASVRFAIYFTTLKIWVDELGLVTKSAIGTNIISWNKIATIDMRLTGRQSLLEPFVFRIRCKPPRGYHRFILPLGLFANGVELGRGILHNALRTNQYIDIGVELQDDLPPIKPALKSLKKPYNWRADRVREDFKPLQSHGLPNKVVKASPNLAGYLWGLFCIFAGVIPLYVFIRIAYDLLMGYPISFSNQNGRSPIFIALIAPIAGPALIWVGLQNLRMYFRVTHEGIFALTAFGREKLMWNEVTCLRLEDNIFTTFVFVETDQERPRIPLPGSPKRYKGLRIPLFMIRNGPPAVQAILEAAYLSKAGVYIDQNIKDWFGSPPYGIFKQ